MNEILVISAHPDDETLGCGGTLLKHGSSSTKIHWLIATCAHTPEWDNALIETKAGEVESVAEAYGMNSINKLGFPAANLHSVPRNALITAIRSVLEKIRPEIVYIVHGGDAHDDHRAMFEATVSVLKPSRMRDMGVRKVLSYETLSSTEAAPPRIKTAFVPNVFHDVTEYMERKLDIMRMYNTEIQPDPMPRGPSAIRALARYRGATIGVEYAEAFMLIRELA